MSEQRKTYVDLFTVFENERKDGSGKMLSMKPKLGKFGLKSITITTNDGKTLELDDTSFIVLNDPRDNILRDKKLDDEQKHERTEKLNNARIKRVATLIV
jgi:hypothetical protein